MAGFREPGTVGVRRWCGDAPGKRLVLRITLAEPPGDLGLHQFRPEIEGVRAVFLHAQTGKQLERVLRDRVSLVIEDMDAVL